MTTEFYSYADENLVDLSEYIEDALRAYTTVDGDGVAVKRVGYVDSRQRFEITVTFSDGSYLSIDSPEVFT